MVDNEFLKRRCRKTRRQILAKVFPFRFAKWNNMDYIENTNCYAYVFNEFISDKNDDRFSYLGWTAFFPKIYYIEKEAEKMMLMDLENLGFKVRKLRKVPKVKRNRINFAFFIGVMAGKPDGDFHFVRQNVNGTWSQKLGYGGNVEYFRDSNDRICMPHKSDYEEVKFIGYYQARRSRR